MARAPLPGAKVVKVDDYTVRFEFAKPNPSFLVFSREALSLDALTLTALATDGGQAIRSPVDQISMQSRTGSGVTLFRVGEGERVVSVARLSAEAKDEA